MNTINVGILGLGRVGASVGLALKRYNARKDARQKFNITGYDPLEASGVTARNQNAVDAVTRSLLDAASNKEILVLALPYREVAAAYRLIGGEVRAGTVILDMSPLKQPSQQWATKYLKGEAFAIGVTPILNFKYLFDGTDDIEHAAADLFDDGHMLLMPHLEAPKEAVELAADLSEILGAAPHFADPAEHDVWVAATEGLPAALGVATFYGLVRRNGWDDARRAGNPSFGRLTHHLFDAHPDDVRDLLLNNRDNVVRQLDATLETLHTLRDVLAQNDQKSLEGLLIDSAQAYQEWVARRQKGEWDDRTDGVKRESSTDLFMSGLFGSAVSKRLRGDKKGDE
ncbi:MAG: prephenate dehydrogenase [Chloroflexi bacterium]|nr:prephenate dehydrogenase [Chloroflexota bacterium]